MAIQMTEQKSAIGNPDDLEVASDLKGDEQLSIKHGEQIRDISIADLAIWILKDSDKIGFQQSGVGGESRTLPAKAQELISASDYPVPTDGSDAADGLTLFVQEVRRRSKEGGMVYAYIPPCAAGRYNVSRTLLLNVSGVTWFIGSPIYLTSTSRAHTLLFAYDTNPVPAQSLSNIAVYAAPFTIIDGNGDRQSFDYTPGDGSDNTSTVRFNRVDGFYCHGLNARNGPIDSFSVRQSRRWEVHQCRFTNASQSRPLFLGNGFSATTDWATYIETDPDTWGMGVVRGCYADSNSAFGMTAFNCSGVRFVDCVSYVNGAGEIDGGGFSYEKKAGLSSDPNRRFGTFTNCKAINNLVRGFYVDARGITIDDSCEVNGVRNPPIADPNLLYGNGVVLGAGTETYVGARITASAKAAVAAFNGRGVEMQISIGAIIREPGTNGVYSRGASVLRILPRTEIHGSGATAILVSNVGTGYNSLGDSTVTITGATIRNSGGRAWDISQVSYVHVSDVYGYAQCQDGSTGTASQVDISLEKAVSKIGGMLSIRFHALVFFLTSVFTICRIVALQGLGRYHANHGAVTSDNMDVGVTTARDTVQKGYADGHFNLSVWALRHREVTWFMIGVIVLLGVFAFSRLAQSEDPPMTFRVMVIRTFWPGANAREVKDGLTDRVVRKLQEMPSTDYIRSYSRPGESLIFFAMTYANPAQDVREEWYQVRKKVGNIAATLPSGVQGPFFNDEFGDVYTHIYALESDAVSPAQLHEYGNLLRTALLRIPGIAKVDFFGDQEERIYIEVANARLTGLGVSPRQIAAAIAAQNELSPAGVITTSEDRVFVRPSGRFESTEALADTLINTNSRVFRLGDIATIKRGYLDPPATQMRLAGVPALGIGVTMQPGADVVRLGKRLEKEVATWRSEFPAGLTLTEVSSMPRAISRSVDEFLSAVIEAIVIVLIVCFVSLGVRSGIVVMISIPVVLAATALCMHAFDISLNKVSLGTLILALGLLVDDAIIAVEAMAVKLESGWERTRAAAFAYTSTAIPMLTGTLVTVAGFLPIALAKSITGEYTRSIFSVSAIALIASWFAAVIVIPLLGCWLLRKRVTLPRDGLHRAHVRHETYNSRFYVRVRCWVSYCAERRLMVLGITAFMFVLAAVAAAFVPRQFFPKSDRPELLLDIRLQEGASFDATSREAKRIEAALKGRKEIVRVVSFIGTGAPRFYLPLNQQLEATNFAQLVITTRSVSAREQLARWLEPTLRDSFPAVRTRHSMLENGPPVGYPVEFRVSGDDIDAIHDIAQRVAAVMRADPRTRDVHFDWGERSERSMQFDIDQQKARDAGVTSKDISDFLAMTLSGYLVTQQRERDKPIAIMLRAPVAERSDPRRLATLAMPTPNGPVPLAALGRFIDTLEYAVIWERDRQPTMTVQADVSGDTQGMDVPSDIEKKLTAIRNTLPGGYRIVAGGPLEENLKGQSSVNEQIPVMVIIVITLLMFQLRDLKRVLIVVMTAPLGVIGVVVALLVLGKPFGFVAMLGVIGMSGIIMRNSVILVDQIDRDIEAGVPRFDAIVGATVRRFRPITVTAAAAVLALIPLLRSNFFSPMAAALMGGITSATALTLFYLPALYATSFRVSSDERVGERL